MDKLVVRLTVCTWPYAKSPQFLRDLFDSGDDDADWIVEISGDYEEWNWPPVLLNLLDADDEADGWGSVERVMRKNSIVLKLSHA